MGTGGDLKFTRAWAMPSHNTFEIKPIKELLARVLIGRECIVDPFARDSKLSHWSNDLGAETSASAHMEAQDFLRFLLLQKQLGGRCDAMLLDPPYSPRQMSECYKSVGLKRGMAGSQTAVLYSECKDLMTQLAAPGCIAVTFGWSSVGFGKNRGWELDEVLLVPHGGAHNDTIVTVETYTPRILETE